MASPIQQDLFAEQMVYSQRRLFGFIVTLVPDRDEAEEIFQETCLALWKSWQVYEGDRDFVQWACGVAKNKVREHFRRRKRGFCFGPDLLDELADTRLSAEPVLDRRAVALSDCLGKLQEPQRRLVETCYSGAQRSNQSPRR